MIKMKLKIDSSEWQLPEARSGWPAGGTQLVVAVVYQTMAKRTVAKLVLLQVSRGDRAETGAPAVLVEVCSHGLVV